jgi:protein SCO1
VATVPHRLARTTDGPPDPARRDSAPFPGDFVPDPATTSRPAPVGPEPAPRARATRARRTSSARRTSGARRARRAVAAAALAAALAVAAAGCSAGNASASLNDDGSSSGLRGTELSAPITKPDVHLTDAAGAPYDLRASTAGKLTLLYFGYTHCPDVCPTTMADIAAALGSVSPEVRSRTSVVFISSDPTRDTPTVLGRWLRQFDPTFVGLTGNVKTIDSIADSVGVPLEPPQREPDGSYSVEHGAQVIAFAPSGPARYVYLAGTQVADYVHDLPLLVKTAAAGTT